MKDSRFRVVGSDWKTSSRRVVEAMAVSMLGVGVVTTSPGGVVRRALGRERGDWRGRRTAEVKGCWAGLGPVVDLDVAIG